MPRKRQDTPFDKIMRTASTLRLYVEYGDVALDGQTPQEFAADTQEALQYLLDFRNMVNSMAALNESPQDAIQHHLTQ